MKYVISFVLLFFTANFLFADGYSSILKKTALNNGFKSIEKINTNKNEHLFNVGKRLFESKSLSLNGNISCRSCHLDKFSSVDGLPNAVGVAGEGEGRQRLLSGMSSIIPRNTLPFWGRGGKGFNVFFWDGKVDFSNDNQISQFGDNPPSLDPLEIAVHLPPVEIREMLFEDKDVLANKTESSDSAKNIFATVITNISNDEPEIILELKKLKKIETVSFNDVAEALAAFIRIEFQLKNTKFHKFIFNDSPLTDDEIKGGLIFYGKGKCSICHQGPYFSDFKFHAIPFPQLGFGKNGFGIDYGRYNVTFNPDELYKFRTPPLYNVEKTAPYGHSGSIKTLKETIIYHIDPLRNIDLSAMDQVDRVDYYKRLTLSSDTINKIGLLDEEEINLLITFLKTLNF